MGPVPFPRTGAPAPRALDTAGDAPIGELDGVPMADVLALHGMGPKGVGALRRAVPRSCCSGPATTAEVFNEHLLSHQQAGVASTG